MTVDLFDYSLKYLHKCINLIKKILNQVNIENFFINIKFTHSILIVNSLFNTKDSVK